jgi:hypothetical protein
MLPVITNQTILKHQPDTVLHDDKEKTCLLINIPILDDSKVNTKETNTNKCKDLEIKVSRVWKVRTKIVPVITGALETIKKGLNHNPQVLPGHLSAIELQKIARALHTFFVECWGKLL